MDTTKKRNAIISYIVKYMKKFDPTGDNAKFYRDKLEKMSDKEFDTYMTELRDKKRQLFIYIPNMIKSLPNNQIFEIADELGIDFWDQIYIKDEATGRMFLTPHRYLIIDMPIRRVKQYLMGKILIPDSDSKIDALTGQVIKPDKGSRLSLIETQILMNKNLEKSILELIKVRGGDVNSYNEFKNKILTDGSVELKDLESETFPRSTIMLSVILNCMHIGNNFIEFDDDRPAKQKRIVYHGSGDQLTVLTPLNKHGDPDIDKVVFGSYKRSFALAYSGNRWSDATINQGTIDGRPYLLEMLPGSIKKTFDRSGFLYECDESSFSRYKDRDADYEVISVKPVTPLKIHKIDNVLSELKKEGVDLYPYDRNSQRYQDAISRMANRASQKTDSKKYLSWIKKENPQLYADILKIIETKI